MWVAFGTELRRHLSSEFLMNLIRMAQDESAEDSERIERLILYVKQQVLD